MFISVYEQAKFGTGAAHDLPSMKAARLIESSKSGGSNTAGVSGVNVPPPKPDRPITQNRPSAGNFIYF